MRVTSVRLNQFRSFEDSGEIELGSINVLIGRNNSGKSSVLRALHELQVGAPGERCANVRMGSKKSTLQFRLNDVQFDWGWRAAINGDAFVRMQITTPDRKTGDWHRTITDTASSTYEGVAGFPNQAPNHFIVPYLSRRKTGAYSEDVRIQYANEITSDSSYLAAKLSEVGNASHPAYPAYSEASKQILGFLVTTVGSESGQRPGIFLQDGSRLPIDQMGDGVPSIVLLLVYLASQEGKLFLIEEPENDLHPSALKALLDLIVKSSTKNQFVISTHSNIVVQHLCAAPGSRLYRVTADSDIQPARAAIDLVPETAAARIEVLQELGYSFSDFDLWDGWLILEESSAERIIRDYLIPWFVPQLRSVRTISANGVDNVEPLFADFNRLVLFTHLMPVYQQRTWVRVDGDPPGKAIVSALGKQYTAWQAGRFASFSEPDFEHYYPETFSTEVEYVLAQRHGKEKQQLKRELLTKVLDWLNEDESRARQSLAHSAAPVIKDLEQIALELKAK